MSWTNKTVSKYHAFAKKYISEYKQKIDCADLAISALVDFAAKEKLPIKFKYYSTKGSKWYTYNPTDDAKKFKQKAITMLGALNVIDNTKPISLSDAKPGDLIMTKWSSTQGHTRIIYEKKIVYPFYKHIIAIIFNKTLDPKTGEYEFTWYQGNLPPVVPEVRAGFAIKAYPPLLINVEG